VNYGAGKVGRLVLGSVPGRHGHDIDKLGHILWLADRVSNVVDVFHSAVGVAYLDSKRVKETVTLFARDDRSYLLVPLRFSGPTLSFCPVDKWFRQPDVREVLADSYALRRTSNGSVLRCRPWPSA
jgi:hypothetical protein